MRALPRGWNSNSTPSGKWRFRMPLGKAVLASDSPVEHSVDPSDGLAEHLRLLFNFLDLVRPNAGNLVVAAFARLLAEFFSQRDALLQGSQGAAERAPEVVVERQTHHVRPKGVTDMATIVVQIVVFDFPHHAIALRAGQDRTPAQPIHVLHAGLLTTRDTDLEPN